MQKIDPKKKLLSVVFFKQRDHKMDQTPLYDKTLPKLPKQPVGFIYGSLQRSKENTGYVTLDIDIRDSTHIEKVTFEKQLEISNYAASTPMSFYEVDHTENNNTLDIEKQSLFIEGDLFYYWYGIHDQLEISDVTNMQSSDTLDYINEQRDLMRQEEDSRDDDKGENAGILNYYECQGFEVKHTLQRQKDRIFFKNTVAIFNNLENAAYVVQQLKPNELRYSVTLVNSSIRKPSSKGQLVGQNRLFADMQLQDLKFGFDQNYFQFVIPRHINFMLSYIYEGHNMKILVDDKTVDVKERINDMSLATKFQSPIPKFFYPLESDVVSGNNSDLIAQIMKTKLKFSKNIVHFDGLKLESEYDIETNMHHKFVDEEKTDKLMCLRQSNDAKDK